MINIITNNMEVCPICGANLQYGWNLMVCPNCEPEEDCFETYQEMLENLGE